jgi:hypothetical protein
VHIPSADASAMMRQVAWSSASHGGGARASASAFAPARASASAFAHAPAPAPAVVVVVAVIATAAVAAAVAGGGTAAAGLVIPAVGHAARVGLHSELDEVAWHARPRVPQHKGPAGLRCR